MLWVLTRTVRCAEARYSILMKPSLRAKEGATEEVSMNGPDDQAAARLGWRLIERLNTKVRDRLDPYKLAKVGVARSTVLLLPCWACW